MVLLVVAAIAALTLAGPPIAGAIADTVRAAFCRILDVGCGSRSQATGPDLEPFPVESHEALVDAGATAFSGHVGQNFSYTKERLSDGTWSVTISEGSEAGVQFELGGHARGDTSGGSVGGGLSGSAGADLTVQSSTTYSFSTEDAADRLISHAKGDAVADVLGPVGRVGLGLLRDVRGDDYEPPDPAETSFEGGLDLSAGAEAGAGTAYAGAEADLSGAIGTTYDERTRERTFYFALDGSVGRGAGVALMGGLGGDLGGEAVIGLTLDENGNAKELSIEASAMVGGGVQIVGNWESMAELAGSIGEAGLTAAESRGTTVTVDVRLDLTRAENRAAALDLVDSLGPGGTSPSAAARALLERIDQAGTIVLRTYETSEAGGGADVGGGAGVKFGFEGELSGSESSLVCASYHVPGQGFVAVQGECAGG